MPLLQLMYRKSSKPLPRLFPDNANIFHFCQKRSPFTKRDQLFNHFSISLENCFDFVSRNIAYPAGDTKFSGVGPDKLPETYSLHKTTDKNMRLHHTRY